MNVNVEGNTHLKGGLIQSAASAEKNQFTTGSLTSEDIQNHSEIEVENISAGVSTNMAAMAMNAVGTAVGALGNTHESSASTAKSAIGVNIQLITNNGEIPTALSRDTETANEKVARYDLAKVQEKQEIAQLIGDIAQNQIELMWTPKVEEAEKQKEAAEAVLKDKEATAQAKVQAQITLMNAQETIKTYGIGSDYQMAVRAVTGVLQGLATGNVAYAAVGGLSPYANKLVKDATTDKTTGEVNQAANLMAHAVLGAIEAYATGNNALAGATGAATAEYLAGELATRMYGKEPADLTNAQKQTITALTQLASGLVGTGVGGESADGISAAGIGKRAVENNAVTPETVWDVANVAIGVTSLVYNINEGNYGSAAIDAAGLAYDGIATVIPFLPAGVSAGLEAYRVGNTAMQSATIGSDVAKAIKAADKAAKDPANIVKNAAVTGTKIHRATGDILAESHGQASKLSDSASSYFRGANKSTGKQPDLSWSGTKVWSDLTTPNQWGAHVRKYEQHYGTGIPILYKPNVGTINTPKLPVGAGFINGSSEFYKIVTDKQEQ